MDALCAEFTGFYRFAKILETLASGIASGKIQVPGGRTVNEEHRLAAAIDLRVRQLEAQGMRGAALLEHMVGHILDLQRLWSTTSDETLAFLCREYPGLAVVRNAEVKLTRRSTSLTMSISSTSDQRRPISRLSAAVLGGSV